jgi:hypothetical protein
MPLAPNGGILDHRKVSAYPLGNSPRKPRHIAGPYVGSSAKCWIAT